MENLEKNAELLVDTFGQEMVDRWKNEGRLYRRKIEPILGAEKVTESKVVETKLPDGTIESSQGAKPGDWIIIGSKGEKFVFTQQKNDRYIIGNEEMLLNNYEPVIS